MKSCLIRDDLQMRAHLLSKVHHLTPALKEIRGQERSFSSSDTPRTGQENVLFMNENVFTIEEQYKNQYNKIIINDNLKLLLINYLASVSFPF